MEPDFDHGPNTHSEEVSGDGNVSGTPHENLPKHGLDSLSPRQREVYRWICEGKRDREIATILGISYRTVTVHVSAILSKLGVENRTCAAMLAKGQRSETEPDTGGGSNGASLLLLLGSILSKLSVALEVYA